MSKEPDLPGLLPALARSLRFAYGAEPVLLTACFGLIAASWIPTAFLALWLKLLADGVVAHRDGEIAAAAAAIAGSIALAWLLRTAGARAHLLFRERAKIAIEAHVSHLQASAVGLEHHERPEFLDRLELLREQTFLLDHMYQALMGTVGLALMLAVTVGLLISIHPALAILALFAIPAATSASWRAGAERRAQDRAAPHLRLARHLFDLATAPGPGKELRVTRTGELLLQRRRRAWNDSLAPIAAARWRSALWHAAAWTVFGLAYLGAVAYVAIALRASPGSILLVLAAGGSLARYLGMTVSTAQFLRWTLDAAARVAWLEDYVAAGRYTGDQPAPERIEQGIRFERVSFRYPGTDHEVLKDVSIDLPAGSVVALVGENGAGKTSLVKLLCRFYEPSEGCITVDGVDLARIPAGDWRERIGGAFQDFMRFEFQVRRTVGLGDQPREDLPQAVETAVARGGATEVVSGLPAGLRTQLGAAWSEGVEPSFGQWQKLALARGFMRDEPLLLVLDEPTAALDAETEHALFERFAAQSRAVTERGRITLLVSHRFSTVRMADVIVVLDGARVVEAGSHEELTARNGLYAELYGIQARGYR